MIIENSRWISRFESELNRKKVFCLYGNIDDIFFYNKGISNLDAYFIENFGEDKIEWFFNIEHFEKIVESLTETDENDEEKVLSGYNMPDFLGFIDQIEMSEKDIIVIKDPKLFFGDICSNGRSFSLRYFLESVISKFENKKIIFISEELSDFPEKLTVNNPYASTIYIDYPEEDERRFYLKDCLNFYEYRENKDDLDVLVKITSKRKLKDLKNIISKAKETEDIFSNDKTMKDILNSYDFGEQISPWTQLKPSTLKNLETKLKKRVKGQDKAVEFVKKVVYRAKLKLNGVMQEYSTKPMGIMFFTGPSGVGKTELAKALTEAIFGDESAFKRFDMSEYKSSESINKLIGSDPGFVGYNEGGQLTNWIMQNPYSVILFDEIDKANVKIWDTFLQILEDGRLTDNKGNTGYFSESIIIFTSNIGNSEISDNEEDPEKFYLNALTEYFEKKVGRVEILNRFGENKIVFNHISEDVFRDIVSEKIELTLKNIKKRISNLEFILSEDEKDKLKELIVKKLGDSRKFGARLVNSIIENIFINEFAIFYMENCNNSRNIVRISVEGEKVKFEC